jgi:hypothetical protein
MIYLFAVVRLDHHPLLVHRHMRGYIRIALETCSGQHSEVNLPRHILLFISSHLSSKLLAVDYIGALLTLAGCALFILPLIWVRGVHV